MLCLFLFSLNDKEKIDKSTATIYNKRFTEKIDIELEVVQTPRSLAIGLMGRKHLPNNTGMLFMYDEERSIDKGFWMYQTKIPLDIAFLNRSGKILSIKQMKPCLLKKPEKCPLTYSEHPYYYAVEMNYDFFNQNNIIVGDNIKLKTLHITENNDIIRNQ